MINNKEKEVTQEEYKQFIKEKFEGLRLVTLPNWTFTLVENNNMSQVMRVQPLWEYYEATIEYCLPRVMNYELEDIVDIILHEVVHCWLAPISDHSTTEEMTKLEEMTTSLVANSIKNLYDHDMKIFEV